LKNPTSTRGRSEKSRERVWEKKKRKRTCDGNQKNGKKKGGKWGRGKPRFGRERKRQRGKGLALGRGNEIKGTRTRQKKRKRVEGGT